MKIIAMVAMAMAVGISARAEQALLVYVEDVNSVPPAVLRRAQDIAAGMFAGVGVRVEWREGRPKPLQREPAIVVHMAIDTPPEFMPGAFALARVYEGVHITVFWDRVQRMRSSLAAGVVLGHVLVHEITHILQGIDRHSETGVMKARWTGVDFFQMTWKPLPFTPDDIYLIQRGLATRAGAGTVAAVNSALRSQR
jgi:hypothetical protein